MFNFSKNFLKRAIGMLLGVPPPINRVLISGFPRFFRKISVSLRILFKTDLISLCVPSEQE